MIAPGSQGMPTPLSGSGVIDAVGHRPVLNRFGAALRRHGWALVLYSLLAVLATWPVVLNLQSAVIGRESDAYVHLWNVHWVEDALVEDLLGRGRFSFFTTRLYYPDGISLLNQNIPWLQAALWMTIKPVAGAIPAYSLAVMAFLVFNGFAGYMLGRDVTGAVGPSIVTGAVILLSPAILDQTNHPNLIPVGFVAMALRSLRRLLDGGKSRDVSALALWLGLTAIMRLQMVFFGAFLWGSYAILRFFQMDVRMVGRRVKQGVLAGLGGALVSALFSVPYLIYHLRVRAEAGSFNVRLFSSDLLCYFLPRRGHILFGDVVARLAEAYDLRLSFQSPALGWVTLGLMAVAFVCNARYVWRWGGVAVALLLLALGPRPQLLGFEVAIEAYARAYRTILLPLLREPDRFNVLLVIPVALMAGWGAKPLLDRIRDGILTRVGVAVVVALIALDTLALPHPSMPIGVPMWHRSLAEDAEDYALAEIPMRRRYDERYMLYQLTHNKALVRGHISRVPLGAGRFIASVPLLHHLQTTGSSHPPSGDFSLAESLDVLNNAEVRYLVFHRSALSEIQISRWRGWFPFPPVYEDAEVLVYHTGWRDQLGGVLEAPLIGHGARLMHLAFAPGSTVPGGWVDVEALWYRVKGTSDALVLKLVDAHGAVIAEWLEPAGRTGLDELLWRRYSIQIPPQTGPGAYALCFEAVEEGLTSDIGEAALCYDFAVVSRERTFSRPDVEHERQVAFGGAITLAGFETDVDEETLRLQMVWRAERMMTTSYKVFVHVLDTETGALVAQRDFVPRAWTYPTTFWRRGEYVDDEIELDLSGLPEGIYEVLTGFYDPNTGARLLTEGGEDVVPLMAFER